MSKSLGLLFNHQLPRNSIVVIHIIMIEIEGQEWKNFIFKAIDRTHFPIVMEFLKEAHFFLDETTGIYVGTDNEREAKLGERIEEYLEDGLSFVVLEKNIGKVVAAQVIGIELPNLIRRSQDMDSLSPKTKISLPFFKKLESLNNIFEMYNISKYADIFITSVIREYRGQGITTEMYKRTAELLKKKGFSIIDSIFTSPYTLRAAKNLGFVEIAKSYYIDHKDEDGNILWPNSQNFSSDDVAVRCVLDLTHYK